MLRNLSFVSREIPPGYARKRGVKWLPRSGDPKLSLAGPNSMEDQRDDLGFVSDRGLDRKVFLGLYPIFKPILGSNVGTAMPSLIPSPID